MAQRQWLQTLGDPKKKPPARPAQKTEWMYAPIEPEFQEFGYIGVRVEVRYLRLSTPAVVNPSAFTSKDGRNGRRVNKPAAKKALPNRGSFGLIICPGLTWLIQVLQ